MHARRERRVHEFRVNRTRTCARSLHWDTRCWCYFRCSSMNLNIHRSLLRWAEGGGGEGGECQSVNICTGNETDVHVRQFCARFCHRAALQHSCIYRHKWPKTVCTRVITTIWHRLRMRTPRNLRRNSGPVRTAVRVHTQTTRMCVCSELMWNFRTLLYLYFWKRSVCPRSGCRRRRHRRRSLVRPRARARSSIFYDLWQTHANIIHMRRRA